MSTYKQNENKSVIRLSEVTLQQNKDKGKISKAIRNKRNIIYKKSDEWQLNYLKEHWISEGRREHVSCAKQKLAST